MIRQIFYEPKLDTMNPEEILLDNDAVASILIVDDQPANLRVLAKMLTGKNYKVRKAINGEAALIAAEASPPDVILLDIKMPDMDGYEVCSRLKSNAITKDIPVIFVSALSETFDKVKAFEVGGIDYITKPFQEEEVIARINSQLIIQQQQKALKQERENLKQEIKYRKEAEAILYQSRALISSILNSSLDGIAALEAVRDPRTGKIEDFRCLVVNPIIAEIFRREPEDLSGRLVVKKFVSKIDSKLFDVFVKIVETGQSFKRDIYFDYQQELKWYHLIAVKLGDGFSITVRDITERKRLELRLNNLATIDGLTGVANRRQFDVTLSQEWRRCQREKQPLSLILIDLDFFKNYNDHYGHQAGDSCLKDIAVTLANVAKRATDLVARYGGEEFAIILPNTNQNGASEVAKTIMDEVQALHIPHQASQVKDKDYVTLSLGITSMIPSPEESIETLISYADQALYQAKQQGRDRVSLISNQ